MTTTTEQTAEQADLLGDAQRAAEHAESASLAVIRPEQQRFDENQRAILRQLGIEDATDGDLDLFFHYCRTTGLDPFRRQIYMIGRNTKVTEWVENADGSGRRKQEKYVTKYTIQTGIDGYRRNVREAAKTLGDELRFEGPFFTGENDFHVTDDGEVIQHWRKVWPLKTPPHAARFVVIRNGEEFEGIAHYDEFVQTGYGDEPNSMWRKMPRNQIAKCAEALAYRRAYPDDLSGLILEDTAQPTILDEEGNVIQHGRSAPAPAQAAQPVTEADILGEPAPAEKPKRQRPSGTRARQPEPKEEPQDAEVVEEAATNVTTHLSEQQETPTGVGDTNEASTEVAETTTADPGQGPGERQANLQKSARASLTGAIFSLFGEVGLAKEENREDRLVVIEAIVGRPVASSNELTDDELQNLRNSLYGRSKAGTLDADVNEWLNIAALKQAEAAENTTTEGN